MNRSSFRLSLVAFALLTGLAVCPALHAQAETFRTAIFGSAAGAVVYDGNFKHYTADDAMTHGYLALSLSPSGKVTGTLTWHGTTVALPLKGKLDLTTGQGHFSQRDANGKKLADAVQIPFLVSKYGLTLSGGGTAGNGESTTFLLTKHYDSSGNYGDEGGGTLTLGSSSYSGTSLTAVSSGSLSVTGSTVSAPISVLSGATLTSGGAINVTTGLTLTSSTLASGIYITGNGTGTLPTVVNGNLIYNGSVLLYGPLTTTTNPDGSTVYTGIGSLGMSTTVTVKAAAASTGG